MTIIEFFDKEYLENIAGSLMLSPARVILCGNSTEEMSSFRKNMLWIFEKKNIKTEVEIVNADTKNYASVVSVLNQLIDTYPDCVFDLTGGDPIILVAMGAVSAKRNVPLHTVFPEQFKIKTIESGQADKTETKCSTLTVEEAIALFGGRISSAFPNKAEIPSLLEGEFYRDLIGLWYILRKNCTNWNVAVDTISSWFSPLQASKESLCFSAPKGFFTNQNKSSYKVTCTGQILKQLIAKGMIRQGYTGNQPVYFFKNAFVRNALSKSGTLLELYTLHCVLSAKKPDRTPLVGDAISGAVIDWEYDQNPKDDIKNEIDVLATTGMVPVFISCKNGGVDSDELYKLSTVAKHFGGTYAKKILVMTQANVRRSFLRRAAAMDIHVIRNVHEMSKENLIKHMQKCINDKL